jgi:probable blue pigment (indigoidine) exporter
LLSTLNIGAFQALLFVAAYRLPGGIAAIAGALQPLMVLSLAWSVDQIRPAATTVATALIAITGMSVLLLTPDAQWDAWGIVAALMGSASMAAGTFFSRRWQSEMPLLAFTGWQLALGGILLLPLAILMEPPITSLSLGNIGGYTYLSIVGTLLAYSLWFRGLSKLSPVSVSALGLLSPLTAVLLGWLVLGEAMSQRNLFGIVLVLASVFALQVQMRPRNVRATLTAREVKAA